MTSKEILEVFEDIFFEDDYTETSRLHSPELKIIDDEVLQVRIFGGLNGWGEWKDYLYDLYELIEALESNGIAAFVTKLEVDSPDDVFYVELELRDFEKWYSGRPE
jgi:hypothetical protein